MRRILGILAGMACGFMVVLLLQLASVAIYPPPPELDLQDAEAVASWITQLPIGAFFIVLAAHALGAFVAAYVCETIVGDRWRMGWYVLGVTFVAAGIVNLFSVPHPIWFAVADLLLYLPAALAGGQLATRPSPSVVGPMDS